MWPVLQGLEHDRSTMERSLIDAGGALRQDSILDASKEFARSQINIHDHH